MKVIINFLTSSVGKKYLMSLTGLALLGFLVAHLLGNLPLLLPGELGHTVFNKYAYHLETLKLLVVIAEWVLIALVSLHILISLVIYFGVRKARPVGYCAAERTKGGESRNNLSSRHMLLLGLVVIAFVVFHVWQFKYGPGIAQGYKTKLEGDEVRDLYRLVVETFKNPLFMLLYVASLGFLAFHLRHGVWSAFQSLGAMPGRWSRPFYFALATLGVLLAVGFIALPVAIFLGAHLGIY